MEHRARHQRETPIDDLVRCFDSEISPTILDDFRKRIHNTNIMDEAQAHEAIALSFGLDSSSYVGDREEAEAAFIGCDPTWLFLDRS